LLEQASRVDEAAESVLEPRVGSWSATLTAVDQAVGAIERTHVKVCPVTDQHYAGPIGHVAIVNHVDQELLEHLIANEAMEHRDQRFEFEVLAGFEVKFEL
jgi:hypothetical protein